MVFNAICNNTGYFNDIVADSFYRWRKPEHPKKTTDRPQVADKLYHITLYWVQWWSTIPPISTKRTITSDLKSLNIIKTTKYTIWHWKSRSYTLGQAHKCGGVTLVNEITTPPSLLIFIKTITKMNDKIKMYSTITRSVNDCS